MISAMPMLIEYSAHIFGTYQRSNRDGEPVFRRLHPQRQVGVPYADREDRDAFALRDSFLTVVNPTEALHFLREAGDFALDGTEMTWTIFQRWQTYARAMHVREEREAVLGAAELPQVHNATYREMVRMTRMRLSSRADSPEPHTYFSERTPYPTSGDRWDELTRYERAVSETAEGAGLRIEATKQHLQAGEELGAQWQRELEAQFVSPVPGTYRVEWETERPAIVFHPRCALEAIANAIQVDRLAGLRYTRCSKKRCGRIIPIGDQKGKQYCNRLCRDAARKQRQRAAASSQ